MQGLFNTVGTIVYTVLLLFIILYIFACIAMEIITKDPLCFGLVEYAPEAERFCEMRNDLWDRLSSAMITLLSLAYFDNYLDIVLPMVKARPFLVLYFCLYFVTVTLSLLNLVAAVIVEGSLEQASTDRAVFKQQRLAKIKKLMPHIKTLFELLDEDQSGFVTLEEIREAPESIQNEISNIINADNLEDIFNMLDEDGGGQVSIDEFCDGISMIVQSDMSIESLRLMKQVERNGSKTDDLTRKHDMTMAHVQAIKSVMKRVEGLLTQRR